MSVRLLPAVHGHIADSVRDHEPRWGGRRGQIARGEEAKEAVRPNRLLPISTPSLASVTAVPLGGKITGDPRPGPRTAHTIRRPPWFSGSAREPGARPRCPAAVSIGAPARGGSGVSATPAVSRPV